MSAAAALTNTAFDTEVGQSAVPVLVDFWAVWCGPCRAIAPTIDELAKDFDGKVKVMKVNVDEEGELAQKFGVMSIPTLIVFKEGKVVEQLVGVQPKAALANILNKHVDAQAKSA